MNRWTRILWLVAVVAFGISQALAQGAATADLHVTVKDPNGAVVKTATVTASNEARAFSRSTTNNQDGQYILPLLPPGTYNVTVEAKGFARLVATDVAISIGQVAEIPVTLKVAAASETVTVSTEADLVETQRSSPTTTIGETRIENLPINGRNYINFALTNSQLARDTAPNIGAAPTSGINFSGSRARANLVNVDGADADDNSTNGVRSTVSQEAVQEFQIITNSYAAEYGRASGGVVNIITKSGTNNFHGSAFGYLRNRKIQAVNPFSNVSDPAYTRVQAGIQFGGALKKDRTFYSFSFETTRRQETGFSNIGANNFGLVPLPNAAAFGLPAASLVTPDQAAFLAVAPVNLITAGYATLAAGGSAVALAGTPGSLTPLGFFPTTGAPLPASYVPLASLIGNFPVSEATDVYSLRLDHKINANHQLALRVGISPSDVTGIQVQAQGPQNFGQNAFSRTSVQNFHDWNLTLQHTWTIGTNKINEARFQYAYRGLGYDFSRGPGGSSVAVNIPGFAFFGREPFSFIRRTEQRFQFSDNFSILHGNHTIKFGGDFNDLPVVADFAVNFGGVYNFGNVTAKNLNAAFGLFPNIPSFSPIQAYGLGIPGNLIQGIGNPHADFNVKELGFFIQDSYRLRSNLTLNYGVRYDVEWTPVLPAANATAKAAFDALKITKGVPTDTNNIAPRIGLAWDPFKDGKTVVRASYGLFYDHPLFGLIFLANATDGSQTPQLAILPGAPGCGANIASALNVVNTFQGIFATCPGAAAFNYLPNEQRFNPAPNAQSVFLNQQFIGAGVPLTFLPFGFPNSKNFVYAYANQANLTVERDLGHNLSLGIEYNFNGGRHLNRPINANPVRTDLLLANWKNALAAGDVGAAGPGGPLGVGSVGPPCGFGPTGVPFVSAAVMNFFRPSGINPSFVPLLTALAPACLGAAQALLQLDGIGLPVSVPFADMAANVSSGSSNYHGLTFNLRKRFSNHYEFLASYTWAHAIDDSTDLQSPLEPQDNYHPELDRSNSTFDQRHRFVFSGVYQSGKVSGSGFGSKLLSDWTLAPIVEVASGRPFNIISGVDQNFDFSTPTDRPMIVPAGTPITPCGDTPAASRFSPTGFLVPACFLSGSATGNLGRNVGHKPTTIFTDLRVARRISFNERFSLDAIMDIFNLPNRFNAADVNPLWDKNGRVTSAFDPRQFQFALRLNW